MKSNKTGHVVDCSPSNGPVFGGSRADLFICSHSNAIDLSYSDLGKSYTHPQYACDSDKAKSFLAGSSKFRTTEVEVFTKGF